MCRQLKLKFIVAGFGLALSIYSAAGAPTDADLFKLYSPSSLMEVRNFSDLPDGVRALANRSGMDARGEGPGGRLRQFLVGGVSETSALVAYEQFGYVPTYMADAYVKNGSNWVAIRSWEIGRVTTLDETRDMIRALPGVAPPSAGTVTDDSRIDRI
jgi:hypothetical protein